MDTEVLNLLKFRSNYFICPYEAYVNYQNVIVGFEDILETVSPINESFPFLRKPREYHLTGGLLLHLLFERNPYNVVG